MSGIGYVNQQSTMSKRTDFSVDDLVFAKVKGYPHWPGIIIKVDNTTYKSVIKYHIRFFGTNEINILNKNDLCLYKENKIKFTLENVAAIHKENYKIALLEIEKTCESKKNSPLNKSSPLPKQNKQTPETPTSASNKISEVTPSKNIVKKINVGVNTPAYLDITVQLDAMTKHCADLSKALKEEKEINSELKQVNINTDSNCQQTDDFHKKILKSELSKFKTENKNLQSTIEFLQNEIKTLEEKLKEQNELNEKCLHCFPPLNKSSSKILQPNNNDSYVSCNDTRFVSTNQFELLSNTTNDSTEAAESSTTENLNTNHCPDRPRHKKDSKNLKTKTKKVLIKQKTKEQKLVIMADSHGRNLGHFVQQITETDVCSHVRPGALFNQVTVDADVLISHLGKKDYVFVIAGTNNLEKTGIKRLVGDALKIIKKTQHTNLILSAVPMRHDVSHLDIKISCINSQLEQIVEEHDHVKLLPVHLLPRDFFTTHGLHLNKKGKWRVASDIARLVSGIETNVGLPTTENSLQNANLNPENIHVIEGDMQKLIEQHQNNPSVAFSHTISADLQHSKNMTAGVAVIFREAFGRPKNSDFVEDKLACQRIPNGGVVYSLVTKEDYFGKPTNLNYDIAFSQLTKDFKRKGLKTLVCSPMGCNRDNITIEKFSKNIVSFQEKTKAEIHIVSFDEKSERVLRRGLTHPLFLEKLKEEILKEEIKLSSQKTSTIPMPNIQHSTPQPNHNIQVQPSSPQAVDVVDLTSSPPLTNITVCEDNVSFLESKTVLDLRNP